MKHKLVLIAVALGLIMPLLGTFSPANAQNCTNVVESAECRFGLPAGEYDGLFGAMQANPAPGVNQIPADGGELSRYSYWKLSGDSITFYDAPNGNAIGTIDPGFNFSGIISRQGDWVEIAPNHWIPQSDLEGVSASAYSGVEIGGLAFPMAWVVDYVRPSQAPGKAPAAGTPILQRYTRVYIYKSVQVGQWEWYLIGPGQWIDQRKVGRLIVTPPPAGVGGRWIAVDLYEQVLVAYDGDRPIFATLISSGLRSWPTREGIFKIWARKVTDAMSGAMGNPDYYSLPTVPWVMYFDKDISLHGTYWHDRFGLKQSHGCVNMSITDARWVYGFTEGVDATIYVWRSR
ncbi:MAG: L,D-transpeptidase family protein [Anaerolineae bacterium]|nr:L,D-transpeptidase family protein [Anaerolineae bacterium]